MKNGLKKKQMQEVQTAGVKFHDSEKAEIAWLREGLKRTPEQRFHFLMKLLKECRAMQLPKYKA